MTARRQLKGLLLAFTFAASAACGGAPEADLSGVAGAKAGVLILPSVPPTVLGLNVKTENVSESVKQIDRLYVDEVGVYSLRKGKLLQATWQVSRFLDSAAYQKPSFRTTLVQGVGLTAPRTVRLGDQTVYLTNGASQQLAVWFTGRYFCVLAIRQDYPTPKALLRNVLEVPV
jgi:hypothetical protein